MGDAAHAESLKHEVFQKPFKVEPEFEYWDTPENYHHRHLGKDKLPKKMKVWRVQRTGKSSGGVVSRSFNFGDYPDDEALAIGYNKGKEYGAVGVGRHGNFLQWGYSAPPSKMTEAGQKFFLNCICYIHKFDGKGPLVRQHRSSRINAIRLAGLIDEIDDKKFFWRTFSPELMKKYERNAQGLVQYYRDNVEFIYHDKVFLVDHELKKLGIKSNRKISTLEQLIELLDDANSREVAKLLLKRYTEQSFQTKQGWQDWLEQNRRRIFFSDFGGFKFRVVPEEYLETSGKKDKQLP
ncbi:MAG: hypothetical protein ACYSSI_07780 [Planctomycetota bacterium]|jgi:hypothetical protein